MIDIVWQSCEMHLGRTLVFVFVLFSTRRFPKHHHHVQVLIRYIDTIRRVRVPVPVVEIVV